MELLTIGTKRFKNIFLGQNNLKNQPELAQKQQKSIKVKLPKNYHPQKH